MGGVICKYESTALWKLFGGIESGEEVVIVGRIDCHW